ncbi:hypothetical protein Cpir12675_000919 [Ceratocystis pirilliformis]|uniref:HECT-type E3 ubiquitin transferase n=1 Tax=Ceratocystis pirilliformis TaxID=259994 RepID=A0ABR3ZIF2_9PEZI
MTRESSRRSVFGATANATAAQADMTAYNDLLGLLWEHTTFPRLPHDAPQELRDYLVSLDDPRQVYKVHHASRRYGFMTLVEKFVHQLQHGCGSPSCSTSTCLTCRQHVFGSAPIRRYNPNSARTLAVYFASQDSPERLLCPFLLPPSTPSDTVNSLSFSQSPWYQNRASPTPSGSKAALAQKRIGPSKHRRVPLAPVSPQDSKGTSTDSSHGQHSSSSSIGASGPHLVISEKPVSKDHRSVSANVFGTVAFRMLEWLTPNSLAAISYKASAAEQDDIALQEAAAIPLPSSAVGSPRSQSPVCGSSTDFTKHGPKDNDVPDSFVPYFQDHDTSSSEESYCYPATSESSKSSGTNRNQASGSLARQSSNAHVKSALIPPTTTTSPKTSRRLSQDLHPQPVDDHLSQSLVSPKLALPEKQLKHARPPQSAPNRSLSEIVPHVDFFEAHNKANRKTSSLDAESPLKMKPWPPSMQDIAVTPPIFSEDVDASSSNSSRDTELKSTSDNGLAEKPTATSPDDMTLLPQSLDHLSLEIIEFVYRAMKEDGTAEKHYFRPARMSRETPEEFGSKLFRIGRPKSFSQYSAAMRSEWQSFFIQSIFHSLSCPQALIKSFSRDGSLLSSRAMWWGLAKLIDSQPTLVFHSLWMASSSLFSVPKPLQVLRSPTTQVFRKSDVSLTNKEAGEIMTICLHALVALIPEVSSRNTLYDISRLRSMGLSVASKSKATTETYLQCDDAYTDEVALRLARRLFLALVARRHYADMGAVTWLSDGEDAEWDVLQPLWNQLDQLNVDDKDASHLERVVVILLDWARTVIIRDWDGEGEFNCNSAFAGAFMLFEHMYSKRRELFISDINLRIDYFSERLDCTALPISWINFTSSSKRKHILDYPFIFSPATRVSQFRAINFSRMNRGYEDSTSAWETTRNPINSTPISNMFLSDFLHERMKKYTSKYLILHVSRENIVKDTFDQLWKRHEHELLRPLKVHLGEDDGEEGFDSGGVQQEFFRHVISKCLDPEYGAFTIDSRTHMAWFVPGSIVESWKFELIGLLMSLALFNGLTLPVTFPKALYRRLLGCPVSDLQHIEDGWPDLANGLTTLLEWDEANGLIEDVFARTYEFSVDMFGEPVSRQMDSENPEWPQLGAVALGQQTLVADNPEDAPMVTRSNRSTYVNDYIHYLTDVSIRTQFQAFQRGFNTCIHSKSLQLLTPPLLQSLVEGIQEIDISELRRYARYVGWDASHRTIRDFWSVVKRFDSSMKRKLLEFVTASDRVPVGGIKNLQFVVQKNGEETGDHPRLPTAYTCYGTLLLPSYRDKEQLKERLCMALENAQGFGFA